MIAVNVDTSRISQLAANPTDSRWRALHDALFSERVALVFCMSRMIELSRVHASVKTTIVSYLRDVNVVFGQSENVLETDELAAACDRALGLANHLPRPFALHSGHWGPDFPSSRKSVADFIEEIDPGDQTVLSYSTLGTRHMVPAQALGAKAAVMTDPAIAVKGALRRYIARIPTDHRHHGLAIDPSEIVEGAGGLSAFPTFYIGTELIRNRLARRNPGEANDFYDEDIARFHPYCAASVLDRKTKDRFWQAEITGRERVTSELADVMDIVCQDHLREFISPFRLESA